MNTRNLFNRARIYVRSNGIHWASLFAVLGIFFMPASLIVSGGGPIRVATGLPAAACDSSLVDASWIAALPSGERHLAYKEARMDLLETQAEISACSPAQIGLPSTGGDPQGFVSYPQGFSTPTECDYQMRVPARDWLMSQPAAERREIVKLWRLDCMDAGSGR